ncbi:unnamed protein product [Coffea canephora]|uniref:Endoglucanase n=1 Tax=Coffea canephora TaxID=49390 RepID=A0A068U8Y5_COFCA|nr:unnamed protein product [Coffea canephora]
MGTGLRHPIFVQQWAVLVPILAFLPFSQCFNYGEALSKSILYYEAQRSGQLPYNQRVTWRHHSGLSDGFQEGVIFMKIQRVDLVGGYYDAGDNVKFGLPMAFTITMLSWSVLQYQEHVVAAGGEHGHALQAIKWGTDYLIKAHSEPHVLWVQVGDGKNDHQCWQRPEDMRTSRRAYKIDEKNPGSEAAGETAAAMAAASIVFRKVNPHYSHILLEHAQQVTYLNHLLVRMYGNFLNQKKKKKMVNSLVILIAFIFTYLIIRAYFFFFNIWYFLGCSLQKREIKRYIYSKCSRKDNVFTKLLINRVFIECIFVNSNFQIFHKSIFVSPCPKKKKKKKEKLPGAKNEEQNHILQKYRSKADYYICANLNKNRNASNVPRTTGGLLYTRKWNPMQYVSTAAFLLMVYSDHLKATNQNLNCNGIPVTADQIYESSKFQVDYILGSNPISMSYLVGYGSTSPRRVHHRGASIEGFQNWFRRQDPNPNVLVGALVGGPDEDDQFSDHRGNFRESEPCTYNTAPLVGIFAKLHALEKN